MKPYAVSLSAKAADWLDECLDAKLAGASGRRLTR